MSPPLFGVPASSGFLAERWRLDVREVERRADERAFARAQVLRAVNNFDERLTVGGSWLASDFHLAEAGTYSDIDAVIGYKGRSLSRLHVERKLVTDLGRGEIHLRVSIHGQTFEDSLDVEDSRLMALTILAQTAVVRARPLCQYMPSKALLSLARKAAQDRYGDVALRTVGAGGFDLYGIKVGVLAGNYSNKLREFAETQIAASTYGALALRLLDGVNRSDIEEVIAVVDAGFQRVPWLRDYLVGKLMTALIEPGHSWYWGSARVDDGDI